MALHFCFYSNYTGSETEFSTEVKGQTVIVHSSQGIHNHGSSKVKLIDRIDYNWEFRYYYGHLVAAHINGKVIAYGMKGIYKHAFFNFSYLKMLSRQRWRNGKSDKSRNK